ncbi:MAG: TetR/AcrR family transcriptional regulator [Myxococcales bacterium]|nr:TetR/AcrR family transcriptional regulator [Myxococcales bacterium]
MARPRSDIAPRIVHAARARFLTEGVDGASLRTIAADAGTSIGMIYYYFPTKDDLFLAVVEETYGKLLHQLEAIFDRPTVPARERLRDAFAHIGSASDEEIEVVRLIVREALVSSTRLDRIVERFQRGHLPMVLRTLADGFERGEIDPSIPLPFALMCTAGLGFVPQIMRRIAGNHMPVVAGLPEGPAFTDALITMLFRAIGPRAAADQSVMESLSISSRKTP